MSEEILKSALSMESWMYRDAPDYGSPELDLHSESTTALTVSADRKSIDVTLASTEQKPVHPRQTARMYHLKLASATLFDANAPGEMNAYYTLHRVSGEDEVVGFQQTAAGLIARGRCRLERS